MKTEMMVKIKNEVISASAGTGKTYQIVNRYLKLLAAGVKPETIVAMTFPRCGHGGKSFCLKRDFLGAGGQTIY